MIIKASLRSIHDVSVCRGSINIHGVRQGCKITVGDYTSRSSPNYWYYQKSGMTTIAAISAPSVGRSRSVFRMGTGDSSAVSANLSLHFPNRKSMAEPLSKPPRQSCIFPITSGRQTVAGESMQGPKFTNKEQSIVWHVTGAAGTKQ